MHAAETTDIAIIGGGPVGSALALSLRESGLQIVLLEARSAAAGDVRPLALSHGSRLILERLGAWPELAAGATPICNIHVSQRGGFGRAGLGAPEVGLPALGYVVDYGRLAEALERVVAKAALLECRTGARVTKWQGGDESRIDYEVNGAAKELNARLIVVADGGGSRVVDSESVDYRQQAVTARVVSERTHNNTAYERFTRHGPLALLPDGDGWALVWTTSPDRAQKLCACEEADFLEQLQAEFGARVGRFVAVSRRKSYPLVFREMRHSSPERVVFIGNAAQTLHPVAGQGFNLGLRDAWELGELVSRPHTPEIGTRQWQDLYEIRRRLDRRAGAGFTHALVQLFSNDLLPLRWGRGMGLALLGSMPPLKNFLIRRMVFGARG